jgi:tetratricopeptide (TPR) repeat protein
MKVNLKILNILSKLKDIQFISLVVSFFVGALSLSYNIYINQEPTRDEKINKCQDKEISANVNIDILDALIICTKKVDKQELFRDEQATEDYLDRAFSQSFNGPYTEPKKAKEIAFLLKDEPYKEYNRKAILSKRKLDNTSAIKYYQRSLEENPNQPNIISALGWMTQTDNSAFLDKERDNNFNNATVLNNIAVRYALLNGVSNLRKSISTFKRVIELQPKYPYNAYKGIMRAYVKLEEYENAIIALKNAMMAFEENIYNIYQTDPKLLSRDVRDEHLYNYYVDNAYLGFLYFKVGKHQESEKYYQKISNVDFQKDSIYLKPSIEYRPTNGSCKDSTNEEKCLNFIKKSLTGEYFERKLSEKGIKNNEILKGIRAMQDDKKNEKVMYDESGSPVRVIFYTDPNTGQSYPIWADIKTGTTVKLYTTKPK